MKILGKFFVLPGGKDIKCPICGENTWEHRISKKNKVVKYRCVLGCVDLLPGNVSELDPIFIKDKHPS